jgi:hypothetical protein
MQLQPSGLSYSGSAPIPGYFECGSHANTATLSVTLTVGTAGAQETAWRVESFDGTARMDIPATSFAAGNCAANTGEMTLSSG